MPSKSHFGPKPGANGSTYFRANVCAFPTADCCTDSFSISRDFNPHAAANSFPHTTPVFYTDASNHD